MRFIALTLSALSVLLFCFTMRAGLSAAHGQEFFIRHLYWGFATLSAVLVTLAFCLMFIFKMHGIIHNLVRQLEEREKSS